MITHLGSELGGWTIDLSKVPEEGTVIEAGTGFDTSFSEELSKLRSNLQFVLIDPMPESMEYALDRPIANIQFILAAVSDVTGHQPLWELLQHSSSLRSENRNVGTTSRDCHCISLEALVKKYNPCLMKLDLEGEEFRVYRMATGVPQVAFEFHHRLMRNRRGYRESNTIEAIHYFSRQGYKMVHKSLHDQFTFVKQP